MQLRIGAIEKVVLLPRILSLLAEAVVFAVAIQCQTQVQAAAVR